MSEWSIRRLGRARDLIGGKRYLEIGVNQGHTFLPFECDHKDAVDPRFLFDTTETESPTQRFFEMPSDAFCAQRPPSEPLYDLAFIDGLHTYEQTLRDLCNVLVLTHDRSVILIDDTLPVDVFSAEPDQKRAIQERRRTGNENPAWHGDVYKVVFFINDFITMLNFATIRGRGNAQTMVWRQPRQGAKPIFNSTEAISRLHYFQLQDNIRGMRVMSEDDAFAEMEAAFAGTEPVFA